MREVANHLGIDQALVSKFESGNRIPTEMQVKILAKFLDIDQDVLLKEWLKERILENVKEYAFAPEALQMVQEHLQSFYPKRVELSKEVETIIDAIDSLKEKLDLKRSYDNFRIVDALDMEYTYESNRIEGNTLTLMETDLVINKGLTISGKSMREHLEAINHKEAIDYIKYLVDRNTVLSERELLQIHNLILRGVHPEDAGKYRSVPVSISGSSHVPSQPFLVPTEMKDYFEWYERNRSRLHPVVLAAEMHERLVTIHPFIDGNGRTARLVMNLILIQNGFVIANIKGDYDTRMKYYDGLVEVQSGGSKEEFVKFIASSEKSSMERYLSILS
jgi:Fic family protein